MSGLPIKERFGLDRFFLGERPQDDRPLLLNQRRIFILPSQRGLGFILLIGLLALIAFVYNNNLAYMLAFLLASVFFITILHTYRTLAGLTVRQGPAINAFAGEAAGFGVIINNPTPLERPCLKLGLKKQDTELFSLPAENSCRHTLFELTQKRGWHEVGTVVLSSTFPLGLFRAWSPVRFNARALVYPKPASQEVPFPESQASQNEQGRFKKGGDDFYALQSYQPGDSLKQIHWKAYAKGLGLYTKQYGGQSSAEIWLDYAHAPGQSTEERLGYLCRWVLDAEQAGLTYGFVLPGLKLAPNHGEAHFRQCLEALALF